MIASDTSKQIYPERLGLLICIRERKSLCYYSFPNDVSKVTCGGCTIDVFNPYTGYLDFEKQQNWKNHKWLRRLRELCQGALLTEACQFMGHIKTNGIYINSCIDGYSRKWSCCEATHSSAIITYVMKETTKCIICRLLHKGTK